MLRRSCLLGVFIVGLVAQAQSYVAAAGNAAYPGLVSPKPVTLSHPSGLDPLRYGRATLPIGFRFPFFNRVYTSVVVTAHGMAYFEPHPTCTTCTQGTNASIPNGNYPNGILAPLWDDLAGSHPTSRIQYDQLNDSNGRGLVVEWVDWNHWSAASAYRLTFQARIYESGLIEFHYGSIGGTGYPLSAGVGIEDPLGAVGVVGKSCTRTPSNATDCVLGDFGANEFVRFGPPLQADLLSPELSITNAMAVGASVQVSSSLVVRNFGQASATGFGYRLFLSANETYEPAQDIAFTPAGQGPLTVGPMQALTHAATSTAPRPAVGAYYVLAVLDDADVVAEADETNNVAATVTPLIAGIDLRALDLTGPTSAGPGEPVTFNLQFANQGIDAAGTVAVKLWLSGDAMLDPSDHLIHSTSYPVVGGQVVQESPSFALPTTVPAGEYFALLQLDDGPGAGVIVEVDDANNVAVGATKLQARQPDLVAAPPGLMTIELAPRPTDMAFLGEAFSAAVAVTNVGNAAAASATASFYLSPDETLNASNDPFLGQTAFALAAGASTSVAISGVVPTTTPQGTPLTVGKHFIFCVVAGTGHLDANPRDNTARSALFDLREPAPDLVPTALAGPARVGVGEQMTVTRTLRNVGNRPASPAFYRYYLSANSVVTEQDLPLRISTAQGEVSQLSVTLASGAEDSATEVVRVPEDTPAGTYHLGVLVDPPGATGVGQVDEVFETNNGAVSQLIQVVAQPLALSATTLPDALIGQPFEFKLSASGGGPMSYSVQAGVGALPRGLALETDGRLHGTPAETGVFGFAVEVASQGRVARSSLSLRVMPYVSSLAITSRALPPVVQRRPYDFFLSAHGGVGPYRWSLDDGALPQGLFLDEDGHLSGVPTGTLGVISTYSFRVLDQAGATETITFETQVVDDKALVIASASVLTAVAGEEYLRDVAAQDSGGGSPPRPLSWRIARGSLPPGIALEPQDEVALLRGTPTVPGHFPVTLEVEDGRGRQDTHDVVFLVVGRVVPLRATLPEAVRRGQRVDGKVESGPGASYSIFAGVLPRGLVLEPAGAVVGQVDDDAPLGPHSFVVASVDASGARGMATFTLEVIDAPPLEGGRCGCTNVPGLTVAALFFALRLIRSRRRGH